MERHDASISLLVIAGLLVAVGCVRQGLKQFFRNKPKARRFCLELTGTFQICACTHELSLLGDLQPKPHVALGLTYLLSVLHGWTLLGSLNNPATTYQQLFQVPSSTNGWCLQTTGQLLGALLAHLAMKSLWMLGATATHLAAVPEECSNPMRTTVVHAFGLECLFSFLLHMTLQQFETVEPRFKVHLVALLITSFVYRGGELTGALFNPALAFSLHMSCFVLHFWNYVLVYWVAPCLGSLFVIILWEDVIPLFREDF